MIELTQEQRQELDHSGPVHARDPVTHQTYVLIQMEMYERIKGMMEGDEVRQMQPLLADLAPEDWEDIANYERRP